MARATCEHTRYVEGCPPCDAQRERFRRDDEDARIRDAQAIARLEGITRGEDSYLDADFEGRVSGDDA